VNAADAAARLLRAGVDGLIGDDPAMLVRVRQSLQSARWT
jgi:hypothetical protein